MSVVTVTIGEAHSSQTGAGNLRAMQVIGLTDIVKQLPVVMQKFYSSEELRTCKKCGTVMEPPKKAS